MTQQAHRALAGNLRERVTFMRRTLDAHGDRLGPWADEFTRPARVIAKTKGETVLQNRIVGLQPVEVTVREDRFTALVDNAWQLRHAGRAYNIRAVAPDEQRVALSIIAEAVNDER